MDSLPPGSVVLSILLTVVLPGALVGAGVLAGVCAATRSETGRSIGAVVAVAGGLAAGNCTRGLLPWWSLEPGWPSLFPATVLVLVGGVGVTLHPLRSWHWTLSLACRLIAAATSALWLAPGSTPLFRFLSFGLIFAAGSLDGGLLLRNKVQSLKPALLLALVIPWGLAAATVLIHAHSARFCDMAVLLSATVGGISAIAAIRKLDVGSLLPGLGVFLTALILGGAVNTFSDVPMASFILIALVPCLLWALCVPKLQPASDKALAITAAVMTIVPCAVAVILALRAETLEFGASGHCLGSRPCQCCLSPEGCQTLAIV